MRRARAILARLRVTPDIALQGRRKREHEKLLRDLRTERTPANGIVVRALDSALAELAGPALSAPCSLSEIFYKFQAPDRERSLERLHKAALRAQLPAVRRPINHAAYRLALRLAIICGRHGVPVLTDSGVLDSNSSFMVALKIALPGNPGVEKLARWALRKVGLPEATS
jgi:hypothetical protein